MPIAVRLFFLFFLFLSLQISELVAFTSLMTTDRHSLIAIKDRQMENDSEDITLAVEGDCCNPRVSQLSADSENSVTVTQSRDCWTISWKIHRSNSSNPVLFYRIYRSTTIPGAAKFFSLVHFVSSDVTTWTHCCLSEDSAVAYYAVSAVDNTETESDWTTSTLVIVATSFLPAWPSARKQKVDGCCIRNHDVAYNHKENEFLVVFDCAGSKYSLSDKMYFAILRGDGSAKTETKKLAVALKGRSEQGSPTVAYNPDTDEYIILFQLRSTKINNGNFLIASWKIDASHGKIKGNPSSVVSGECGIKTETIDKPHISFNPKTFSFVFTAEMSREEIQGSIGVRASSEANYEDLIQSFAGDVGYTNPRVIYEPNHDSLLFAAQIDKKWCEKQGVCSGYSIVVQRIKQGSNYSKCIIAQTLKKDSDISLLYDEANANTVLCYIKKKTKNHKARVTCLDIEYEGKTCVAYQRRKLCPKGQHSVRESHVIYYPPGHSVFAVWSVSSVKLLLGNLVESRYFGKNATKPVAFYQNKTGNVCVVYQAGKLCAKLKVQCFKPSSKCKGDCPSQVLPCGLCGETKCHKNAVCIGNLTCQCKSNYTGNGMSCVSLDKCSRGEHDCSPYADCLVTGETYTCTCKKEFEGNGQFCRTKNPCQTGQHICHKDATCTFLHYEIYRCGCREGLIGNGTHCSKEVNCSKFSQDECKSCQSGYIGNGRLCCKSRLADVYDVEVGNKASLHCFQSCFQPYLQYRAHIWFIWYFRNKPVNTSDKNYKISNDGSSLIVEKLASKYTGSYTCRVLLKNINDPLEFVGRIDLPPKKKGKCDCGTVKVKLKRIHNAKTTKRGELPWQAMLCYPSEGVFCGGVMISRCCILTTARCTIGYKETNYTVCLGKRCGQCNSEQNERGSKSQCFEVTNYVIHPGYRDTGDKIDNDIALLKVPKDSCLKCNEYTQPVCLPQPSRDKNYLAEGKPAIVSGWGENYEESGIAKCLGKGEINVEPLSNCAKTYGLTKNESETKICATDVNGACRGDSGSPLITQRKLLGGKRWVLAGLASYGIGCGSKTTHGVYTRVDKYLDWIYGNCDSL